jgi:MFS family permease
LIFSLNRQRLFLAGLGGFAAFSALCGAAPDAEVLIAARALQGAFAALVVPSSLALVLPEFPADFGCPLGCARRRRSSRL